MGNFQDKMLGHKGNRVSLKLVQSFTAAVDSGLHGGVSTGNQLAADGKRVGLTYFGSTGVADDKPVLDATIHEVERGLIATAPAASLPSARCYYTLNCSFSADLQRFVRVLVPLAYFDASLQAIRPEFDFGAVTTELYDTSGSSFKLLSTAELRGILVSALILTITWSHADPRRLALAYPTGPVPDPPAAQVNPAVLAVYSADLALQLQADAAIVGASVNTTPFFRVCGQTYLAVPIGGFGVSTASGGVSQPNFVGPVKLQVWRVPAGREGRCARLELVDEAPYSTFARWLAVLERGPHAFIVNSSRPSILPGQPTVYSDVSRSGTFFPPLGSGDGKEIRLFRFDGRRLSLEEAQNTDEATTFALTFIPGTSSFVQSLAYPTNGTETLRTLEVTGTGLIPGTARVRLYDDHTSVLAAQLATTDALGKYLLVTGQEDEPTNPAGYPLLPPDGPGVPNDYAPSESLQSRLRNLALYRVDAVMDAPSPCAQLDAASICR